MSGTLLLGRGPGRAGSQEWATRHSAGPSDGRHGGEVGVPGGDDASIDHIDDLFERVPEHLLAQLHHRDVDDPRAEYAMEIDLRPQIENSHGSLQGGLAATLVDMAAGRVIVGRLGADRVPI